jgi:hypothetical protein
MGRYGEEIGSDQFGATIMASASQNFTNGTELAIIRISNIEVTNNHLDFFYDMITFVFVGNLCRSSISSRSISDTFTYEW